ncbi:protein translocase subunit SecD [Candidatus Azoamicus ciliaticola]|uniref:Protein translocase subunit SecD n=1 Tax=Candidatus Azoamicus ciliaticola TaxID=2652803 RepID=A0A6J5JXJ9_9GAMM|nr:protein translocase subunit SecD [Candidatus Azoamicus ciliaticola]CAB3976311.1 Protein translocase subunit SecD [Candidatus Azoamicus ciliaticola]
MTYKKLNIIIIIFIISLIYSYPNIYGEDPAIIIKNYQITKEEINENIKNSNIKIKSIKYTNKELIIRFFSTEEQFLMFEKIKNIKNIDAYQNILNSEKIKYFEKINAYPMKLGLDLRGGVHLVTKINTKQTIEKEIKETFKKIKRITKIKDIEIKNNKIIKILKNKDIDSIKQIKFLTGLDEKFDIKNEEKYIFLILNKEYKKEIKNNIMTKTLSVLTKRLNELGISETIIQRNGTNKITIDLPGIQNIEYAKNILGKTATLDFMLLAEKNEKKKIKTLYDKEQRKIKLKNKSIIKGESIIYASSGFENTFNKPCVNIKINENAAKKLNKTTIKNIGKPMAIIYKESYIKDNKEEIREEIISIAKIMSPLNEQFQITGLNIQESKNLALLLRSGSLPTTLSIIEEKIIGPSLGEDNIKNSIKSLILSVIIIALFMIIKYKKLGLISTIALITNITLMISIMSILNVTLTLSGIAGIILTIGMSIDSNILIFERIKEESKINSNINVITKNGFNNALSSIIDANITSLLMALILFLIGAGPIKGFAIALSLGIITSIYSSLIVTKSIINFLIEKNIKIT